MIFFVGFLIFSVGSAVGVWVCAVVDERERQTLKKELEHKDASIGLLKEEIRMLKEENRELSDSNQKLKEALTKL